MDCNCNMDKLRNSSLPFSDAYRSFSWRNLTQKTCHMHNMQNLGELAVTITFIKYKKISEPGFITVLRVPDAQKDWLTDEFGRL